MNQFMGDSDETGDESEKVDETIEAEVIDEPEGEITQDTPQVIQPVDDLEEVKQVYERFEEIKTELLKDTDVVKISGNNHIKKSGWRKIATAFNVSTDVVDSEKTVDDGVVRYKVKVRAEAPNGKSTEAVAICASNESNHMERLDSDADLDRDDVIKVDGKIRRLKSPKEVNDHNLYATASTRAKNRAISDLVGGGEVSAEEMNTIQRPD